MKTIPRMGSLIVLAFLAGCAMTHQAPLLDTQQLHATAIIVDHTCVDLDRIPPRYIVKAQEGLGIAYGHTSHGSQLVSGMQALMDKDNRYAFDTFGSQQALSFGPGTRRGLRKPQS